MRTGDHDDVQDIRDELADLRAELESVRQTRAAPWTRARAKVRSMRRLTVVGIAALMLAVPVAVSAVHDFTDVPTSNTFHTSISRLVGAGITGGCGSGKYCPNSAVTRGQMAAFLNRGLGRMGSDLFFAEDWDGLASPGGLVATVDLLSGGGGGGTAHAFATANFNAWTDEAGVCPCEIQIVLYNPDTDEASFTVFDSIGADGVPTDDPDHPGVYWQTNATVSYMFTVESGTTNTYQLFAAIVPTTEATAPTEINGLVTGWASSIEVVYVPYDATGENPTIPATTGGDGPFSPRGNR